MVPIHTRGKNPTDSQSKIEMTFPSAETMMLVGLRPAW